MLQTLINESTYQNSLLQGSQLVEQVIPVVVEQVIPVVEQVIPALEPDRASYCTSFFRVIQIPSWRVVYPGTGASLPIPGLRRSAPFSSLPSTQKDCMLSLEGAASSETGCFVWLQNILILMTARLTYFPYLFYLFIINESAFLLKIIWYFFTKDLHYSKEYS